MVLRLAAFLPLILCLIFVCASAKRPNILLVFADDLGYYDLDWKDKLLYTPNLRKYAFASSTVHLTNSYVLHLCTPTRSSLMTGYYPFRTGTQDGVFLQMEASGVPLDFPFLPQNLRKIGYKNYLIGKWHLGYCKRDFLPTVRGFDYFYGFYNAQEGYFNHSSALFNKATGHLHAGLDLFSEIEGRPRADWGQDGVYSTHVFTQKTIRLLTDHDRKDPFFLFLSYQSVHAPLQVPKQYLAKCNAHRMDYFRYLYCGMLVAMDESFGQVMETLKSSGLYNNTIVIFSSDNGGDPKAGASNGPLRGQKSTVWEGGTRTTTFIHSPRHISQLAYRKHLFHVVDWHATILGMAGIDKTTYGDGINLWPMIVTGNATIRRNQFVYNIQPPLSALRQNDFKLVYEGSVSGRPTGRARLFDLARDPNEHTDVARKHPKLVKEMVSKLFALQKRARKSVRTQITESGAPEKFDHVYGTGFCR